VDEGSPQLRSEMSSTERPLACPLCQYRFSFRDYARTTRTCPRCKVPIGFPFYYRAILFAAYLLVAGFVVYKGYDGMGGLLVSLPFAALFGLLTQVAILRVFPPRLQAYAVGGTWLTLNAPNPDKAPGTLTDSH
jgi:hypothetical protein